MKDRLFTARFVVVLLLVTVVAYPVGRQVGLWLWSA